MYKVICTACLVILPWLNPFAPGPWAAAGPLMFSWACAFVAILILVWRAERGPSGLVATRLALWPWLIASLVSSGIALIQFFGVSSHFQPLINVTLLGEAFANLRQRNQFASLTNIGLLALIFWVQSRTHGTQMLQAPHAHHESHVPQTTHAPALSVAPAAANGVYDLRQVGVWLAAALLGVGNAASSSRTGLVQILLVALLVVWWGGRGGLGRLTRWNSGMGDLTAKNGHAGHDGRARHAGQAREALQASQARNTALVALLAYGLASVLLPVLIGREWGSGGILSRLNDGGLACGSRLTLWSNVIHLIGLKPWLGWGWGELDFAHFITLYPSAAGGLEAPAARFCEILDNAHNLPLHLAVELGIPLAVAFCGTVLWLIWRGRPWREQDAARQMAWGVLAVIGLHSLLEYPLWYGPFQMAVALCVWILVKTPSVSKTAKFTTNVVKNGISDRLHPKYEQNYPLALVFIRYIAIISIAFLAYAAWDYHRISQIYLPVDQRSQAYRNDTLAKIQPSRLFKNQVAFAELTTTRLSPQNAAYLNVLARELLHFSPESRVAEKLIESSVMLGRDDEALFYLARYRAAFPAEHALWAKAQRSP